VALIARCRARTLIAMLILARTAGAMTTLGCGVMLGMASAIFHSFPEVAWVRAGVCCEPLASSLFSATVLSDHVCAIINKPRDTDLFVVVVYLVALTAACLLIVVSCARAGAALF